MSQKNRIAIELTIIGIVSLLITFLFKKSICVFINIFGIPCPACGLTRASLKIIELNFREAFRLHPLFWSIPFLLLCRKKVILYGVGILFIIVWVIRMYFYFPNVEPFIFNQKALYPMILKKMRNF